MKKPLLILVTGHPATGKTTLSRKISSKLKMPLVSSDKIKEIIWDNIGWEHTKKEWNNLGRASFELMHYFIQTMLAKEKSLIAEAHFNPKINNERVNKFRKKYGCTLLQIYCSAKKEVIAQRFRDRIKSGNYHMGHKHGILNIYSKEKFLSKIGEGNKLLDIDGKTIKINTTNPENIDYNKIFKTILN